MQGVDTAAWRDVIKADTFANYHREMGLALWRQDPGAAIAHFRKAVEFRPALPDGHVLLVSTLRGAGQDAEAQAADEQAQRIDPLYQPRGHVLIGLGHLAKQSADPASAAFAEAARIAPDLPDLRLAQAALALGEGRSATFFDPLPDGIAPLLAAALQDCFLAVAQDLLRSGNFACAQHAARQATVFDTSCGAAHKILGYARARLSGPDAQVLAAYQTALEASPWDAELHCWYAEALSAFPDRLDEALRVYERAAELDPRSEMVRHVRITFLCRRGMFAEALAADETVLATSPGDLAACRRICCTLLGWGRFADAVETGRLCINRDPHHAYSYIHTALGLQALHRHGEALALAQQVSRANPDDAWVESSHGLILLGAGKQEEAMEHLRRAALRKAHDNWVATNLAIGLLGSGEREEFLGLLRQGVGTSPLTVWYQARIRAFFAAQLQDGYQEIGFPASAYWAGFLSPPG